MVETPPHTYAELSKRIAPLIAQFLPWTGGYHCPWSHRTTAAVLAVACSQLGAIRNEGYESAVLAVSRTRGIPLYDVLAAMAHYPGSDILTGAETRALWQYATVAALHRAQRMITSPTIWADRSCSDCTLSLMTVWGGQSRALPLVSFDAPPRPEIFGGLRFRL